MRPIEMKTKVCMVGDPAVGKTSLIRQFAYSRFDDNYTSTLGTMVSQKSVFIDDSVVGRPAEASIGIWDLPGQREFEKMHRSGLRGSSGVIVVTDLTRRDTLDGATTGSTRSRAPLGMCLWSSLPTNRTLTAGVSTSASWRGQAPQEAGPS